MFQSKLWRHGDFSHLSKQRPWTSIFIHKYFLDLHKFEMKISHCSFSWSFPKIQFEWKSIVDLAGKSCVCFDFVLEGKLQCSVLAHLLSRVWFGSFWLAKWWPSLLLSVSCENCNNKSISSKSWLVSHWFPHFGNYFWTFKKTLNRRKKSLNCCLDSPSNRR